MKQIFSKLFKQKNEKDVSFTYLGYGIEFSGKMSFEGELRIDGNFQGEIIPRSNEKNPFVSNNIFIGKDAEVSGNINADTINIWGKIGGGLIKAGKKIIIQAGGDVRANILTSQIIIHEGGKFTGSSLENEIPKKEKISPPASRIKSTNPENLSFKKKKEETAEETQIVTKDKDIFNQLHNNDQIVTH